MKMGLHICCILGVLTHGPVFAQRIISTSPQITQLLSQLGKLESVIATPNAIGTNEFPNLLPIGPLFAPSIERTLKLNADWILGDQLNAGTSYFRAARALRLRFAILDLSNLERLIASSNSVLAEIFGESERALVPFQKCLESLDRILEKESFGFLAFAWMDPPVLFSGETLLSDLLTKMGGKNVFPKHIHATFPEVSSEWLMSRKVDRVFYLSDAEKYGGPVKDVLKRFWKDPPPAFSLPSDIFSRSNFGPVQRLRYLKSDGQLLPKECRDIQKT